MPLCNKCKEWKYLGQYCDCREYVAIDENGEKHEVWAKGVRAAAERFAKDYDGEDHILLNEESKIIIIGMGGNATEWIISAEPNIYYNATRVERKANG